MLSTNNSGNELRNVGIACSWEETMSPMTNPVVLAHLFKICDLSDLRRFRLVSKQWHGISLTRWRGEMILRIHVWRPQEVEVGKKPIPYNDLWDLFEETELMKFRSKPFRRYRMGYLGANRFWEVCGPSMTFLELDARRFPCVHSLALVIFENTPNLVSLTLLNLLELNEPRVVAHSDREWGIRVQPHLKRLKVSSFGVDFDSGIDISWPQFFHHFPSVEELEIEGSILLAGHHLHNFMTPLESGRGKHNWRHIRTLNISNIYGHSRLKRIFALPQMKLESLHFGHDPLEDDVNSALSHAFQLHGHTLKKLHLFECTPRPWDESIETFHSISNTFVSLAELYLKGGVCHTLNFLSQTPNLRVLHINQVIIPPLNLAHGESIILPWLEELHIKWMTQTGKQENSSWRKTNFWISYQILEVLANWMPNVKHFKSKLTAEALQIVCTKWKALRSLHVTVDGLSDSAITGSVPGQEELVPNLTDLKYLEVLRMENSDNLTDASVFKGFFQMARLHTLKVILQNDMSDDAVKALVNRFTVFKWRYQEFPNLHWNGSTHKNWIKS